MPLDSSVHQTRSQRHRAPPAEGGTHAHEGHRLRSRSSCLPVTKGRRDHAPQPRPLPTTSIRAAVIIERHRRDNVDASLIKNDDLSRHGQPHPHEQQLASAARLPFRPQRSDSRPSPGRTGDFDYIVIETSGICEPIPLLPPSRPSSTRPGRTAPLDTGQLIVANWSTAPTCTTKSSTVLRPSPTTSGRDVTELLIQQVRFCTTLVLNKCDRVTRRAGGRAQGHRARPAARAHHRGPWCANVPMDELQHQSLSFDGRTAPAAWIRMPWSTPRSTRTPGHG